MAQVKETPVYETLAFRNDIVKQIQDAFTKDDEARVHSAALGNPINFSTVMGPKESHQWWLLYIDPKDWPQAKKEYPANPGILYDKQKSPGFEAAITTGYEEYLLTDKLAIAIETTEFNWEKYFHVWKSCRPEGDQKYIDRFHDKSDVGTFNVVGDIGDLAKDVQELVKVIDPERPMLGNLENTKKNCCWVGLNPEKKWRLKSYMAEKDLQIIVNDIFNKYREAIRGAKTRYDQLRAIARLVRTLHLYHCFSDGCGRVNVYTILPALLLHHGFGLTMGGKNAEKIHPAALYMMFNGGYSIDEIAEYLWAYQDFGLLDPKQSVWAGKN